MSSHQNGHPKLEIMKALVCSTAHITHEEALHFVDGEPPVDRTIWASEYGWMFYIGKDALDPEEIEELTANCSPGLRAVIEKAWQYALDWVRLDRDGEIIEGIPTYDW